MVVQLAFDDGAAIVDALALPDLRQLALALTHATVVGHALSADLKIFADRFDLVPPRVFDTQIAAAFLGYGMQVSLADLVRGICGVRLAKSQTVSDWSARPFSERQIEYLVGDVAHLLPLYEALRPRLDEKGRYEWVYEECAELGDIERYRIDERRALLADSRSDANEPARARYFERAREAARSDCARARPSGAIHAPRRRRRGTCVAQAGAGRGFRTAPPPRRGHETSARLRHIAGRGARAGARRSGASSAAEPVLPRRRATRSFRSWVPRSPRSLAMPASPRACSCRERRSSDSRVRFREIARASSARSCCSHGDSRSSPSRSGACSPAKRR